MLKLKRRKYFALLGIIILVFMIAGIFAVSKYDKYKGLITIKNANTKLLGDVTIPTKGTDKVTYQVKYTLDTITGLTKRDVIIRGTLKSDYARFKPITDTNIISNVSNDGKTIEVTVRDVPLGEEQALNLNINVVNAPNNEEIKPVIEVKESTGEYTKLETDTILVQTNSIEGIVYDDNNEEVPNIELSLYKDGNEVKRTYTNKDGKFVYSDLETGNYNVRVEEDIYDLYGDSSSTESNDNLILRIKEVDKFNIETHKYITNLKLIIDGKEENYSYDDVEKVVKSIKKFNNISVEIEYKIVVKNNSNKQTMIKEVIDEVEDGLSFATSKNPGWVLEDNKVRYTPLEGVILNGYEKREAKIRLDIKNTKELGTYINKFTTKGEINERVIFILNGEEIRNITVQEGSKITKPSLDKEVTWYTDRNLTNKYDFSNGVTKDLILYGATDEIKYNVTFKDGDNVISVDQTNYGKIIKPTDPEKDGYSFKCWTLNDTCFDFDDTVEADITLVSSYELINYDINYGGLTPEEIEALGNPTSYNVESDTFTLNNPSKRKDSNGYNLEDFVGWDDGEGNISRTVEISIGSINDRTYTAVWRENQDDYNITYNLNGGTLSSTNPNSYKRSTDDIILSNPSKEGYNFTGWTGSNGDTPELNVTIPKGSAGPKNYTANYETITYTINYSGLTPEEISALGNPTSYTIESDNITLNNPTREGYTFTGWSLDDSSEKIMTVVINTGSISNRTYTPNFEINRYTLTINPNGGIYNGSSNPVPIPNDYGTILTLDNPSKTGYNFTSWSLTGKGSLLENVYTYSDGNGEVTANYEVITYNISYEGLTNEEITSLNNPITYTVEDEITLTNPSDRLDSDGDIVERFTGWTIDGSTSIVGTIPRGSTGNKTITANFTHVDPDTYTITYNLNGGSVAEDNPTSYTKKTNTFTLNNPTKEGYDFAGWTGTGLTEPTITVTIPRLSTGDREYTATYNTITYSINYDLNGGTATGNPTTYDVESDSITLVNPTKEGYDFTGWTGTGLTEPTVNVTIPSGSTENRSYTANYEKITYSISYDLNGGTATGNPTTFDVESDSITLVNPTKEGYDFAGWTGTGFSEPTVNVTIPTGSIENREYTANYSPKTYAITYEGLTPEEITALGNPTTYTIETDTFTLNNPENRKDSLGNNSEDFVGWDDGEGNVSTNVTIDLGSTNNKTYTAIWKTNEDAYSITYILNGGTVTGNPTGYTRTTNTFTLNNPSKEGHTFIGWTGTGLSEPTLEVTIPYGSAGDRTYTANYSINQSTLNISPNGGKYNNKTTISTYTEDYGTVLVIEPSERDGYTFDSYTLTGGGSYSNNSYTFGATDGTLTASYTPITYNLSYSGLTDEEISALGNPTTYTTETPSFTLHNPSNRVDSNNNPSEDFVGWDDGEGNVSLIVTINPGEMGDKTYTAVWNENQNSYSITYNLNDGTYAGDGNPNTYKRSTETFTLNPPSKAGYTFLGWTGSNGETPELTVTIPKGSAGNKTFTANYQTINYTINYGGLTPEEETTLDNPTTFTIESDPFTVANPTQRLGDDGYPTEDFVGWDDGEGNIVDTLVIDPTNIGNKEYTAVWEDNTDNYSITYNLNGGSVTTDNPITYNRKTETFALNNPTKNGYTFTGWSGTGIEGTSMSVTIPKGSAGPRVYTANYVIANYTISYAGLTSEEISSLGNPTSYNENTAEFTLNNPTREGYTFTGWSGTDIDLKTYTVTYDYQDGRETTSDTYSETSTPNGWLVNDYHYDDNAVLTLTEDIIITRDNLFGENAITLPKPTRENYVFDYWNSMPDGSGIIYDNDSINSLNSDTTIYAIWHPEKVNITFEENGGTEVSDIELDYNTAIGTLPVTTKTNYIFEGWFTTEDYDVKVSDLTVFTKDQTLYAKWEEDPFPYVYGPYTDSLVFDGSNYINTNVMLYNNDNWEADYEIGFTIESYDPNNQPHTQSLFMNTKYENKNLNYPGLTVRKSSGDIEITSTINGNKTNPAPKVSNYTLPLTIKIYRINKVVYYSVNDGQRIELQSMANFNQQFELPVYFGAGDDGSGGTQRYIRATMSNMYIKMGTFTEDSSGNTGTYNTADLIGNTAAAIQNDVTHTFNGETTPRPNGNLNTGATGSGVINVIDPDGIISIHEYGEEYNLGVNDTPVNGKRMTVTVPTGSTGNRLYVAHFEPSKLKVTYMDGEDKFYEEEVIYNRKASGTLDVPTKAHNVFVGWYLNDTLFDFSNTPITENITLTSRYEEVEAPYITYSPNTWTNDKTTVTISSDHDDYTYMYKIGDGDYQEYTGPFDISENTTVYAYSVKNTIASLETSVSIDNIDKIDPVIISADFGDITQVNAELNLSIQDEQSGLDKFKVYVDNELVYESLSYTTLLNEVKNETYLIGNLEAENTYTIKIEVFDTIGNIATRELNVTTANRTPVARTLTFEGVEIETYPTLQDALDSDTCVSKCYIEMLDNVRENNTILSSQDITIDLNGKQINGGNTYAFINNGRLTILDRNETNVGRVLSSTVAIKNNEFLQIGENEDPLSVSDIKPIIEGNTKGVETDGTLNYFDGHIIGDTPIYGLVSETPYSYNVTITETQTGKPESALVIMADAVARRNTTYYSEVQTGIDESTNGELDEIDMTKPLIQQLRSNDFYRFVYDEETHSAVNNNKGIYSTTAHSYIKLDLTNYDFDPMLFVNYDIYVKTGSNRSGTGYIYITDSADMPGTSSSPGRIANIYEDAENCDINTILKKGQVYFLHFIYEKYSKYDSILDTFRINSISLGNSNGVEFSGLDTIIMYNDTTDSSYGQNRYHFEKQSDGSYVNTNNMISNTSAHSYFVVDMTNINEDKYLNLNLETITNYSYETFKVAVTNTMTGSWSSNDGVQVQISKATPEKTYTIHLYKNQINYIHFYCFKSSAYNSYGETKFIIKSITPLKNSFEGISDGVMVNNGDYYFKRQEDGSYISNNQGQHGKVANSYMLFDMTGKPDMNLTINATISSESADPGYITVTNSPEAPSYNSTTGRVYYSGGNYTSVINVPLSSNKLNYVHFGYRKDSSVNTGEDCFKINSISLLVDDPAGSLPSIDYFSTQITSSDITDEVPILNQNPETVQLLRNVTLSRPLEIVNTRNVILDLNGHTLDTSSNDFVIKNNGALEIIDSEYQERIDTNTSYKTEQARLFEEAKQQYLADLAEYNEYAGLCDGCSPSEQYVIDQSICPTFEYTGTPVEYTVVSNGKYKLQVWGAQGGGSTFSNNTNDGVGGSGGYSEGEIDLTAGEKLYIYVGGHGLSSENGLAAGGFNGGGSSWATSYDEPASGGGGATDIRVEGDSLYNRIIVAGGGGGGGADSEAGGHGGGIKGTSSYPGTQTGTSSGGAFGYGANTSRDGGAGGGGWYGGGTYGGSQTIPTSNSSYNTSGSSGGSGFVYTDSSNTPVSGYLVTNHILTNAFTKDGLDTTIPTHDNSSTMTGNTGDGYARITNISLSDEEKEEMYSSISKTYDITSRPILKDYLNGIDFDSSVDIDELDVDSEGSYNNTVSDAVNGAISSNNNSVIFNEESGFLNIKQGNILLNKEGLYNSGNVVYSNGITNYGTLTLGKDAYVKTLKRYNIGIFNSQSGDIIDGSGNIINNATDSIGILNNSVKDTYIKGYNLSGSAANASIVKFKNQSYHTVTLDDFNFTGYGLDLNQNGIGDLIVNNSILNSLGQRSLYIYSNSPESTTTFNNCRIMDNIYIESKLARVIFNNSDLIFKQRRSAITNSGFMDFNNSNIYYSGYSGSSSCYSTSPCELLNNYGTLNINGGKIDKGVDAVSGVYYAIVNGYNKTAGGTVNITGNFEISNYFTRGIHNVNGGTVTIGNNDETVSTTYPLIKSSKIAIYNSPGSDFNYYDGKLIGELNSTISGPISSIPVTHDINIETPDVEIVTLKSYDDMLNDNDYVASIGSNNYVSIQSAIDSVQNSDVETEIVLLKNVVTAKNNIIPDGKNISLNQKGYSLRGYNTSSTFTNNGTFTLTDDSTTSEYENTVYGNLILNNGTATYDSIKTFTGSEGLILTNNIGATLNILGGEIYSHEKQIIDNYGDINIGTAKIYNDYKTNYGSSLIKNNKDANLIANGSEIVFAGNGNNAYNDSAIRNSGHIELYNLTGNISSCSISGCTAPSFVVNLADSTAKIEGGTYTGSGYLAKNSGTVTIDDVSSTVGVYNFGSATLTDGVYNGGSALMISESGELNITGSSITGSTTGNGTTNCVICLTNKSTVNLTDVDIKNIYTTSSATPQEAVTVGITYGSDSILNINSGSITSLSGRAIYINNNSNNKNAIITIGTKDANASKNNPNITGKTYGLYNGNATATVNFYDGIITGETAIFGGINEVEEGYEIILESDGDIEHKYLDKLPLIKNIDKNDTEYYSIQEAIDDASDGDRLELLREYTTASTDSSIVNNKNIIIDLKGFKISQNNEELFTNNGSLTINTSVDGASIEVNASNTFINNSILNIDNILFNQPAVSDVIKNNSEGTVNITNSEFNTHVKRILNNYGEINLSNTKMYSDTVSNSNADANMILNNTDASMFIDNSELFWAYQPAINNYGSIELRDSKGDMYSSPRNSGYFLNNQAGSYAKIDGGIFGENGTPYYTYFIYNSGILDMTGHIINKCGGDDAIYNKGTINITNANIEHLNSYTFIRQESENTMLNFINSSVIANTSETEEIIYVQRGIVNIVSGSITNNKGRAISLSYLGELNIGTSDGNSIKNNPIITGGKYGFYNPSTTSTLNFYDGTISGETAIFGNIANIEDGYEIISETDDSVESNYLDILPLIKNIDKNNEQYYSIQTAIDDANDGDRLELLRNYIITGITPSITNTKDITLDLHGYKINQKRDELFINNGILTIKSSIDGGMIETSSTETFINNSVLNIESGLYKQYLGDSIINNTASGTLNITGGEFYTYRSWALVNYGTSNISDAKFESSNTYYGSGSDTKGLIYNGQEATITANRNEIKGYQFAISNYGNIVLNDCVGTAPGDGNATFLSNQNNAYAKVNGGSFSNTGHKIISNSGTLDLTGNISNNSGALFVIGGGVININNAYITQGYNPLLRLSGGTLNIDNSTLSSSSGVLIDYESYGSRATVNINSGTLKTDNQYAITMRSGSSYTPTLNIGTLGGVPSTTDPVIQGKDYGVYNDSANGKIYFYDGVVKGETGSFNGPITDYEPGYKEERNQVTDPDTGVTTWNSTLTIVGTDTMKLSVGNINFETLQSAVNYAVANSISRIDLHKDLDLSADVVKPDGINVDVYLNGHTINNNGYTIGTGINLVGANSGNGLGANIFGSNKNSENIVIYQFDDGSELDTNMVYRLYELDNGNYEIVNINENRVGNYDIGSETDELHTTNGKIYINNVPEGTYKLTAADGREINFEILPDGVTSNIRINNKVIINRIVETVATVILTIQTGITRHHYILFVIPIIIIIAILFVINKKRKREIY